MFDSRYSGLENLKLIRSFIYKSLLKFCQLFCKMDCLVKRNTFGAERTFRAKRRFDKVISETGDQPLHRALRERIEAMLWSTETHISTIRRNLFVIMTERPGERRI